MLPKTVIATSKKSNNQARIIKKINFKHGTFLHKNVVDDKEIFFLEEKQSLKNLANFIIPRYAL